MAEDSTGAASSGGVGVAEPTSTFNKNIAAVVAAGVATGALGLLFWFVVGRRYPPHVVGEAAALVNTTVMISTLSSTAVGSLFERFLPLAGRSARSFVASGQAVVLFVSICLGSAAGFVGPLSSTLSSPSDRLAFIVFLCSISMFALQDHVTTGLGVARWGAYKNIAHAAVKLILAATLSFAGSAAAILFSWWLPAAAFGVVVAGVTRRRIGKSPTRFHACSFPPVRAMFSFFIGSVGVLVVGTAVPLVLPLIVLAKFGAAQTAYFTVAWQMISASVIALHMLIGPFVTAAVSADNAGSKALINRFGGLLVALSALVAGGLGLVGPMLLRIVGGGYYTYGTPLLHYAAAVIPLTAILIFYQAISRLRRRLRIAVALESLSAVIVLVGVSHADASSGLTIVGLWFLIGQGLASSLAVGPLVRALKNRTTNT